MKQDEQLTKNFDSMICYIMNLYFNILLKAETQKKCKEIVSELLMKTDILLDIDDFASGSVTHLFSDTLNNILFIMDMLTRYLKADDCRVLYSTFNDLLVKMADSAYKNPQSITTPENILSCYYNLLKLLPVIESQTQKLISDTAVIDLAVRLIKKGEELDLK